MCSMRNYLDQVAQHELDNEGPMDPERKIQLQTEIQVLSSNLELRGVNPVADNCVENLQVNYSCFLLTILLHSKNHEEVPFSAAF